MQHGWKILQSAATRHRRTGRRVNVRRNHRGAGRILSNPARIPKRYFPLLDESLGTQRSRPGIGALGCDCSNLTKRRPEPVRPRRQGRESHAIRGTCVTPGLAPKAHGERRRATCESGGSVPRAPQAELLSRRRGLEGAGSRDRASGRGRRRRGARSRATRSRRPRGDRCRSGSRSRGRRRSRGSASRPRARRPARSRRA